MSFPRLSLLVGLFLYLHFSIFAQNEQVKLPLTPEPNQTIHRLVVIETSLHIASKFQGIPEETKLGPAKFSSKIVLTLMQKVGKSDTDGNTTVEAFCEDAENEMIVDGRSLTKNFARNVFINQIFAITYDSQGHVKGYKLPANIDDAAEPMKQMLRQMTISMPVSPLRIGESASTPLIAQLPLPDAPLDLFGETIYQLLAIENIEKQRIAKFQISFAGKMKSNENIVNKDSNVPMVSNWSIKGGGSFSVNLKNQTVKNSDTTQVLDALITIGNTQVSTFMKILSSISIKIETIK